MKNLFYLLCFNAIVVLCFSKSCPSVNHIQDFNFDRFQGGWFVIYKSDTSIYACKRCILANYQTDLYGTYIEYVADWYTPDGTTINVDFGLIHTNNNPQEGLFKTTYLSGYIEQQIINVNYTEYAVMYACSKSFFAIERHAWILSRDPEVTDAELEPAFLQVEEMGFDRTKLVLTFNMTECEPFLRRKSTENQVTTISKNNTSFPSLIQNIPDSIKNMNVSHLLMSRPNDIHVSGSKIKPMNQTLPWISHNLNDTN